MTTFRVITIAGGLLLLLYGLWALHSGIVISTWGRMAYRPSAIFWITVIAFLLLGGLNLVIGVRSFFMK